MKKEEKSSRDRYGLDKDARLAEEREREARETRERRLDPPFPYRVIGFDLRAVIRDER